MRRHPQHVSSIYHGIAQLDLSLAALLMCYRHNYDLSLAGSIEDIERKPLKNELSHPLALLSAPRQTAVVP